MSTATIPAELGLTIEEACALSLECWRLSRIAEELKDSKEGAGVRHAVRRITKTLEDMGIGLVDFAGRNYDPGMVPEVLEVREDQGPPHGRAVIEETIAPTVTWLWTGRKTRTDYREAFSCQTAGIAEVLNDHRRLTMESTWERQTPASRDGKEGR